MHTATLQEERAGFAVVCMCLLFGFKTQKKGHDFGGEWITLVRRMYMFGGE